MTQLLGHRGASADHPENTLRALLAAVDPAAGGAAGVEFDVRLDGAGRAMVFHDADTQRLTGLPGRLDAHAASVVAGLRVAGEPIPTLAEALRALADHTGPRRVLNVELKTDRDPARVVAACRPLLDPLGDSERVELVVSSFDPRVLAAALETPWRLALLYEEEAALQALPFLAAGDRVIDLHPRHDLIDAAHLAEYAAPRRLFRTWTVDDVAEARRLTELGIAAIITNRPGALRAELSQPPDAT